MGEQPDLSVLPKWLEKQALYWKARSEGDWWAVDRTRAAGQLMPYRALAVALKVLYGIRAISTDVFDLRCANDAIRQIEEMGDADIQ